MIDNKVETHSQKVGYLGDPRMRSGLSDWPGRSCNQRFKLTIGAADKPLNDLTLQNSLAVANRDDDEIERGEPRAISPMALDAMLHWTKRQRKPSR